jgi:hypothetical protein
MKKQTTFLKGYPWFKIVWLWYTDETVTNEQRYVERWLVVSNKNNYIIDGFNNRQQAVDWVNHHNDWWEKDYRLLNKVKGNALWDSLLG